MCFFFLCGVVTPITFTQAICLLVWVWEGRLICTNAPSRLCYVSKSAPVSIQIKSPHLLPILPSSRACYYHPHPVNTPASLRGNEGCGRERESLGYYLMRSRSARVLFTVTKQTGAALQEPLSLIIILFLGSCGCRLHLNNHHFTETVSALTRCFFLSRHIPPIPDRGCIKTV